MPAHRLAQFLILPLSLAAVSADQGLAQNVHPIQFTQNAAASGLKVYFIDVDILADEHWHVAGSCEGAGRATDVYSATIVTDADIRVAFTKASVFADRSICITNPDEAPKEFWKIYNQ